MSELVKVESVTISVPGERSGGRLCGRCNRSRNIPVSDALHGARWLAVDSMSAASRLNAYPNRPQNNRKSDRCLENLCTEVARVIRHRVDRRGGIRKEFSDRLLTWAKTVADRFDFSVVRH